MVIFKILGFVFSKLFGGLLQILTCVIERWRVFLPLAIVVLTLWALNTLATQRNDARKQYAAHITADKTAADQRRIENTAKYLQTSAHQAIADYKHNNEVNLLRNQYAKLKTENAASVASASNWRERVRLDTERYATATGLTGSDSDSGGSAERGRDCNAANIRQAYENLELACAITTSDYNRLRHWADGACEVVQCK